MDEINKSDVVKLFACSSIGVVLLLTLIYSLCFLVNFVINF